MIQLIYASAATEPFSPAALRTLLQKARVRNTLYGVSGMLLYHSGSFVQVLEGKDDMVRMIHNSIVRDKRHTSIRTLSEQVVQQREFGSWSMGFADTSAAVNRPDGLVDYHRELAAVVDAGGRARKFLRFFQEGLYRQSGTVLP